MQPGLCPAYDKEKRNPICPLQHLGLWVQMLGINSRKPPARKRRVTFLKERSATKEIMDLGGRDSAEIQGAYRLLARVNRFLGGRRVILKHLERFAKRWSETEAVRILDVGTGGGDIPKAIIDWARKKRHRVLIFGLDKSEEALSFAREQCKNYPEIFWVHADLEPSPFLPKSFDYVVSSMTFHHLSEAEAGRALAIFETLARRGIIVNDLLRRARAYLWISFFSRFTKNKMFRNDAPLSVLRGFRREEVERIKKSAGTSYLQFYEHFGHRFALAGEKSEASFATRNL